MTSLIDVIFLLLLFFMLSSTFSRFAEIEIISGGGRPSQEVLQTQPLFLKLQSERLILNGNAITQNILAHSIQTLAAGEQKLLLIAPVGDEVSSQNLVDVMIIVRALENVDIRVLD